MKKFQTTIKDECSNWYIPHNLNKSLKLHESLTGKVELDNYDRNNTVLRFDTYVKGKVKIQDDTLTFEIN